MISQVELRRLEEIERRLAAVEQLVAEIMRRLAALEQEVAGSNQPNFGLVEPAPRPPRKAGRR